MAWLARLFGKTQGAPPVAPGGDGAPDAGPPNAQLIETVQKLARVQARMSARLEELDGKLEAGFMDVRALLAQQPDAQADDLDWDDLLDAMDTLDEAVAQTATGAPEIAGGLRGVLVRLERFAAQAKIERHLPIEGAPDARLFRVVGTVNGAAEGAADGARSGRPEVARVVRAAVVRGEEVIREGEVIVKRTTT